MRLWGGAFPKDVGIVLPKGETPVFPLALAEAGDGWARVGITKDAGDDPDVTHGEFDQPADICIEVSVPGGQELALKTWNPRLGITGGLSILGTTGVVRPFSCAAWIASIHRGIDVARADGLTHVAGCTGATSERTVQALYGLPDHAMLDMGDFAGGMLKYLEKHPVPRVTLAGGIGKMTKLAQGAFDLHSGRSQVDFDGLAKMTGMPAVADANTALEAYEIGGSDLARDVAWGALNTITDRFGGVLVEDTVMQFDVVVVDRAGAVIAKVSE